MQFHVQIAKKKKRKNRVSKALTNVLTIYRYICWYKIKDSQYLQQNSQKLVVLLFRFIIFLIIY